MDPWCIGIRIYSTERPGTHEAGLACPVREVPASLDWRRPTALSWYWTRIRRALEESSTSVVCAGRLQREIGSLPPDEGLFQDQP